MSNVFTDLCINALKEKLTEVIPDYQWDTEHTINSKKERIQVDIYGETEKSNVLIEFEMHRRQPVNNAYKILKLLEDLQMGGSILIIHIFSPFYEVDPYYKRAKYCEVTLPELFIAKNAKYSTHRWTLDKLPSIRTACQHFPDSKKDFPPLKDIKEAVGMLASDLITLIK